MKAAGGRAAAWLLAIGGLLAAILAVPPRGPDVDAAEARLPWVDPSAITDAGDYCDSPSNVAAPVASFPTNAGSRPPVDAIHLPGRRDRLPSSTQTAGDRQTSRWPGESAAAMDQSALPRR